MATGKIDRLPRHIRDQLSKRLDDGECGDSLIEWLNGLPEVKDLCEDQFKSVPVSKQNLSAFEQGPHQEWLRGQEDCRVVQQLAEQAGDLGSAADNVEVSDALGRVLTVEMARTVRTLLAEAADTKERWRRLQEVFEQLAQLRKADHRAQRRQMEREQRDRERERDEEEQSKRELAEAKRRATEPFWAKLREGMTAKVFGGGEYGQKVAEFITAINYDLPMPAWAKPAGENGQAQSRIVKDGQG
jgi:hypothetical protein